jgi:alpha-L-fucosidase
MQPEERMNNIMPPLIARRALLKAAAVTGCVSAMPRLGASTSISIEDRTQWFERSKFGMFIHWGPYSVASVEASWPILTPTPGGISEAEYRDLPKRFNPTRFDPDGWVSLAKAAGQRYMVFTTKHHDGFCMFDSVYTNYKITNTPYGKDVVAQLAAACQRQNMPLGFYYSPPDENHPAFRDTSKLASANYRGQPQRPEWPLYLDYMSLQLDELLTKYGPVALMWFDAVDMSVQAQYDGVRFLDQIHRRQPQTIVNNRLGGGDYETPEQFIPKTIPVKSMHLDSPDHRDADRQTDFVPPHEDFRLWESCMTINDTWAYNRNDHSYKSSEALIRDLVEVVSRGGNFLLDVGPGPDGTIQPEFQERLLAVGKWLNVNGPAVYGTTYGPIQGQSAVRTTTKPGHVFVYVFDWPKGELKLPPMAAKVTAARMIAGGATLSVRQTAQGINLGLPQNPPDNTLSVIDLRLT